MKTIEERSITAIRILAADAIQKANSGHPGMVIGSAPMGYALWKQMKHNPKCPTWQGRDRFVLSAGHASMLEYALLHLFGYDLTMDDIKNFRQLGSRTPGHPEFRVTAGVEASSGPLGQGIAMAVGMAMAETKLAKHFNRDGFPVVDNYTYAICGDGCMMEGVQAEAVSLAGTLKLSKLIVLYDCNKITIEGDTDATFDENIAARYAACGWQVISVSDGEDINAIDAAIKAAKAETDKPSLIIVRTTIACGTPKAGKASAHGEPLGAENVALMREHYNWELPPFEIPEEVYEHFSEISTELAKEQFEYETMFESYKKAYPELYAEWEAWHDEKVPEEIFDDEDIWAVEAGATRASSGAVLNKIAKYMPNLFGGSADLGPSNKTELKGKPFYGVDERDGSNMHFGIREFAMAAVCNGMMLYGGLHTYCASFLSFVDYLKPALRMSALMRLPVLYVFTHDSIGVGEDGPTHQPIEQVACLRATPNTLVFRPCDARETVAAYMTALKRDLPSVMILSRQNLPLFAETSKEALKGGYILRDAKEGNADVILIATGSEVEPTLAAASMLEEKGVAVRVVSMLSTEIFDEQSEEYKESVLPKSIRKRIVVEAGTSFGWHKYVGIDGAFVTMDTFGKSAPAKVLFKEYGFTAENIANTALKLF